MLYGEVYQAVLRGDAQALDRALRQGADANARNNDNLWTSLMLAVSMHRADLVGRLLLEPKIDVNARSDRGQTALHLAAEAGSDRLAELLLEHPGIDPNAKDARGWTPLTTAAFANRIGVLRRLLSRPDVAVNFVDRDRQTALHWAVLARQPDAVRELLHHSDINVAITNRPGRHTAYEIAQAMGLRDIARVLRPRLGTGDDELSTGDLYSPRGPEETPGLPMTAFIPEPPRRRTK